VEFQVHEGIEGERERVSRAGAVGGDGQVDKGVVKHKDAVS